MHHFDIILINITYNFRLNDSKHFLSKKIFCIGGQSEPLLKSAKAKKSAKVHPAPEGSNVHFYLNKKRNFNRFDEYFYMLLLIFVGHF